MLGPGLRTSHFKRMLRMRFKNHSEKSKSKPMTIFAKKTSKAVNYYHKKLFFPSP